MVIYATHNIITKSNCPNGYLLLKVLRSYVNLDMYASLEVHTASTIVAGRKELLRFSRLLKVRIILVCDPLNYIIYQEYENKTEDEDSKSWLFPKRHTHAHMFDDIEAKGVTKNYNTKPSEQMHGTLKKTYSRITNFKEVEGQVCSLAHLLVR